jgi:DNA-directed RNA polymerase specialized sigma24 family protein
VIELVDLAGLRPREAAAALGLRPGTVRMRLMRARTRLRQEAQSAQHQDQDHIHIEGQE